MRIPKGYRLLESCLAVLLTQDNRLVAKGPARIWPCAEGGVFFPESPSPSNADIIKNARKLRTEDGRMFEIGRLEFCRGQDAEHFHLDLIS